MHSQFHQNCTQNLTLNRKHPYYFLFCLALCSDQPSLICTKLTSFNWYRSGVHKCLQAFLLSQDTAHEGKTQACICSRNGIHYCFQLSCGSVSIGSSGVTHSCTKHETDRRFLYPSFFLLWLLEPGEYAFVMLSLKLNCHGANCGLASST